MGSPNTTTTAANLVIETLALSEAELRARLADLEADVLVYRELACTALESLHEMTTRLRRMQATLRMVLDDDRAARVQERAA